MVEDGMPYHLTLGTIVMELANLWFHGVIDTSRLKEAKIGRDGLAFWAQIHCLESKGIASRYVQLLKESTGPYAQGYKEMLDLMEKFPQKENPFQILRQHYQR